MIVLAAGGGTRMKSKTMKVLHPIAGRSMIGHVLAAVSSVEPHRVVAVVGHQREQVGPHIQELLPEAVLAVQESQDGTGHAVRIAWEALDPADRSGTVLVAYGDTPLLEGESLRAFAADHLQAGRAVSILSGIVANPFGYGRVLRDAVGRGDRHRRGEGRQRGAGRGQRDQQRDPGLRRGVPRRRAPAADQRQRQGRVLPHRRGRPRPRRRARRRRLRDRRRAADRGGQRPGPARFPRQGEEPAHPGSLDDARASPSSTPTPPGSTST